MLYLYGHYARIMGSALVVIGCVVLVAFFVWIIWLCLSTVEKTERGSMYSDLNFIAIVGERLSVFLKQKCESFKLNKEKSITESLVESFFKRRWRTVLLVVGFLAGWYVWPTPFKQLPLANGITPQRENRFTKEIQYWDRYQKRWK